MDDQPEQPRPTAEHYRKQKSQQYAYFRVRSHPEELEAFRTSRFTIFDFITHAFAFSQPKKDLAIRVFTRLHESPATFSQLQTELSASKSSLFLVLTALEKSGLVSRPAPREPYQLCTGFSDALDATSAWWRRWVATARRV